VASQVPVTAGFTATLASEVTAPPAVTFPIRESAPLPVIVNRQPRGSRQVSPRYGAALRAFCAVPALSDGQKTGSTHCLFENIRV
jgi:hypothetical protein